MTAYGTKQTLTPTPIYVRYWGVKRTLGFAETYVAACRDLSLAKVA